MEQRHIISVVHMVHPDDLPSLPRLRVEQTLPHEALLEREQPHLSVRPKHPRGLSQKQRIHLLVVFVSARPSAPRHVGHDFGHRSRPNGETRGVGHHHANVGAPAVL
eukprot:scaffold40347_cov47-Prasinocladus_malaysianus.AAC.1